MSFLDTIAVTATRQHGAITRAQLRAGGASDRNIRTLVDRGILARPRRGVYVLVGAPDVWLQRLSVAVLAAGPGAGASHRAASALLRLDDFRQGALDVCSPRWSRRTPGKARTHESMRLPSRDLTVVRGIAATTATRTLIDVGRFVAPGRLVRMMDDAVRRELTSYEELHQRLHELAASGRNGIVNARTALDRRPGGSTPPGSALESIVLDQLLDAELPTPVLQFPVECDGMTYLLDLAWPDQKIAVECDGFRFHRTPEQLDWDDRRRTQLALRGWMVLHVTWNQMRDRPDRIVEDVRRGIDARAAD